MLSAIDYCVLQTSVYITQIPMYIQLEGDLILILLEEAVKSQPSYIIHYSCQCGKHLSIILAMVGSNFPNGSMF